MLRGRLFALGSVVRARIFLAGVVVVSNVASGAGIGNAVGEGAPAEVGWTQAVPGWNFEFPRDHGPHPDFKSEWWYFTGNLRDAKSGRQFGYELTFFRQGIRPAPRAAAGPEVSSRFAVNDFKFAHFAISDLDGKKFHFDSKVTRGAFAEAGFGDPSISGRPLAWIETWNLTPQPDGSWRITARNSNMELALDLRALKAPVIHGNRGISQKSDGAGNASHYYSFTRLETAGRISVDGVACDVTGTSWFDHEWASNQLSAGQVGWDWFCLQFDDDSELMLYSMRQRDGSIDPNSSGTLVDANGNVTHLRQGDFVLRPIKHWTSARTGGRYPIAWDLEIPAQSIVLHVSPRLEDQELALGAITYWEGAVAATGTRAGRALSGVGYLELTGYAEELGVLKQGTP